MNFSQLLILAAMVGVIFLINLPLGKLRRRHRRLSFMWFLYIHLSVPLIHYMRTGADMGPWAIPFFVIAAVVGQVVGGKGSL